MLIIVFRSRYRNRLICKCHNPNRYSQSWPVFFRCHRPSRPVFWECLRLSKPVFWRYLRHSKSVFWGCFRHTMPVFWRCLRLTRTVFWQHIRLSRLVFVLFVFSAAGISLLIGTSGRDPFSHGFIMRVFVSIIDSTAGFCLNRRHNSRYSPQSLDQ